MTTEELKSQEAALPRLDAYFWAAVLIWMGLVFGADAIGILPEVGEANAWSWIFLGGGIAGLLLSLYSLSSSNYATPTMWDYLWSALMLAFGLGGFLGVNITFPVILIVIGLGYLASVMLRRE
jgi:hypothetical protein